MPRLRKIQSRRRRRQDRDYREQMRLRNNNAVVNVTHLTIREIDNIANNYQLIIARLTPQWLPHVWLDRREVDLYISGRRHKVMKSRIESRQIVVPQRTVSSDLPTELMSVGSRIGTVSEEQVLSQQQQPLMTTQASQLITVQQQQLTLSIDVNTTESRQIVEPQRAVSSDLPTELVSARINNSLVGSLIETIGGEQVLSQEQQSLMATQAPQLIIIAQQQQLLTLPNDDIQMATVAAQPTATSEALPIVQPIAEQVEPALLIAPPPQPEVVEAIVPRQRQGRVILNQRTYLLALRIENCQNVQQYSIGRLNCSCNYCGARFYSGEFADQLGDSYRMCCNSGNFDLPALGECPNMLYELLTTNTEVARQYRKYIRLLNSNFAMASFRVHVPEDRNVGGFGAWCFTVSGQLYHYAAPLPNANEQEPPRYNQFYFIDMETAIEERVTSIGDVVDRVTIERLENMLRQLNRYVTAYVQMGEVLRTNPQLQHDNCIVAFKEGINADLRTVGLPVSRSEVAAIFVGDEPPFDVQLKVYGRARQQQLLDEVDGGQVHRGLNSVHYYSYLADPMVYPLLFPHGEHGWHNDMPHFRGNGRITLNEFYKFRIMMRELANDRPTFSLLHNSARLFQQYVVSAWMKIEADRIMWIRRNQTQLRVADYTSVHDRLRRIADRQGLNVGRVIILPANHIGSPRYMYNRYTDALITVAKHGRPDLFITMTCNPMWPEIREPLYNRQKREDRPDIVDRVFHRKLMELIDDIMRKQIFGCALNYMYVIEFQKRGLPHAHILVTLQHEDKINNVDQIDQIVKAEFPSEADEPRLHEIVCEQYIHRMCGEGHEEQPCMRDGRCTKFYPKDFSDVTRFAVGPSGRVQYRRRNTGELFRAHGNYYDNRRVVPYNPYCAVKYNCHMNIEICSSIGLLKYLYRYVYKGHDTANVEVTKQRGQELDLDEVTRHLDCRYVSSTEAMWHILQFRICDRSHSVERLPVHLPGAHDIIYDENDDDEAVEQRLRKQSKLCAWMELNRNNPRAHYLRYSDIVDEYSWNVREAQWKERRQVSKTIGSLNEVSPGDVERFHLRILLLHRRGVRSFDEMYTGPDGIQYGSFRETCVAYGLLQRRDEYALCFAEAVVYKMPRQLRHLFAVICSVAPDHGTTISDIWREHQRALIEDFTHARYAVDQAIVLALAHIQVMLNRMNGQKLTEYGLPAVTEEDEERVRAILFGGRNGQAARIIRNDDDRAEVEQEVRNQIDQDIAMLTREQRQIFNQVIEGVRNSQRSERQQAALEQQQQRNDHTYELLNHNENMFYVDGPGGTGKTHLFNLLIRKVQASVSRTGDQKHVMVVAWTGIAATLLVNGQTVHRAFRLPLHLTDRSSLNMKLESAEAQLIKNRAALILWDEAPMTPKLALHTVDRFLRKLMNRPNQPMGGKVLVMGGDFRQTLPIVRGNNRTATINASLLHSPLWPLLRKCRLTINMRAARLNRENRVANDDGYSEWLLQLGDGKLPMMRNPNKPLAPLIHVPPQLIVASEEDLISQTFFADNNDNRDGNNILPDRAILCPTNENANAINEQIIRRITGELYTYYSVDSYKSDTEDDLNNIPMEMLNSINVSSLPPHVLQIKRNAIVMLLRNIDLEAGLCNGTRLRVMQCRANVIECELLTGSHAGETVYLPRIEMQASDTYLPKPLIRFQFPVRLSYAMTINKSQGQTLRKVGICLKKPCFSHGQLYVAFSRVGSFNDVHVFVETTTLQGPIRGRPAQHRFTVNIVYETVLESMAEFNQGMRENDGDHNNVDVNEVNLTISTITQPAAAATAAEDNLNLEDHHHQMLDGLDEIFGSDNNNDEHWSIPNNNQVIVDDGAADNELWNYRMNNFWDRFVFNDNTNSCYPHVNVNDNNKTAESTTADRYSPLPPQLFPLNPCLPDWVHGRKPPPLTKKQRPDSMSSEEEFELRIGAELVNRAIERSDQVAAGAGPSAGFERTRKRERSVDNVKPSSSSSNPIMMGQPEKVSRTAASSSSCSSCSCSDSSCSGCTTSASSRSSYCSSPKLWLE